MRTTSRILRVASAIAALSIGSAWADFLVHAPSRTSKSLWTVRADISGETVSLRLVEKTDLGFTGVAITAHPDLPLLYVASNRGTKGEVPAATVHLGNDGRYESHSNLMFQNGSCYVSLDRGSRFLLSVNYRGGEIDVYPLDGGGNMGERVAGLDEGRANAHAILVSPDNRFVYIPYVKDSNALLQYGFDPGSGKLTALDPPDAGPPPGTGPRHIAYHPEKPFVYFSNEQHLGVSVYAIGDGGRLDLKQVCDAVNGHKPVRGISSSDIVITPDGQFLFASVRGNGEVPNAISRYRIGEDGMVELLGLTPADETPWGLALSPDANYLLVSAAKGATLGAYRVSGGGELSREASLDWDPQITDLVTLEIPGE